MKKILASVFVLASLILAMQSCDKIEEPYLELVRVDTSGGTTAGKRVIILEEFTGHKCVNCPEAALLAHNLKLANNGQIVLVSIHAGYFATTDATGHYTTNLATTEGEEINSYFGVLSNPAATINRNNFSGKKILTPDKWESAITEELAKEPEANLEIETSYNTTSRNLSIVVNSEFIKAVTGDILLSVGITESNIIAAQKNNNSSVGTTPDILDYSHQHVLRAMVNGTWGQTVKTGGAAVGDKTTSELSYELPEGWNHANCAVFAYLSYANGTNKYVVIQAAEKELAE
jgi:hypothetical protein